MEEVINRDPRIWWMIERVDRLIPLANKVGK